MTQIAEAFHKESDKPGPGDIFVFGSNLAGRHGAGAAKTAALQYGAVYGQGIGRQGSSYAIPTKDENIRTLSIPRIADHVREFLVFAAINAGSRFYVTRIGCGLAGYRDEQIAPLFRNVPSNCVLPRAWAPFL